MGTKWRESQLEVGAFGSWVKPQSQVEREEPVTGWVGVLEPSWSMPRGAAPGAELPARMAAPTRHRRNPSTAGYSILAGESWASQLNGKVFESKLMLFANQRVKKSSVRNQQVKDFLVAPKGIKFLFKPLQADGAGWARGG